MHTTPTPSQTQIQLQGLRTLQGALSALSYQYEDVIPLLATQASVKDGNDTAIGMLKDNTNGLAAIKSAIPSVQSIQSGLAKTSELPSDYAKPSDIPTVQQI